MADEYSPEKRHRVEHLRASKNRKISSARWLQRQINDPFVREARAKGYRSRSTFKIMEIHQNYNIFRDGYRVLDLGSTPGGWSQLAVTLVGRGNVFALDTVPMEPIAGVKFMKLDFLENDTVDVLLAQLGETKFDIVMSDMAPNTSGDQKTDHLRIIELVEKAIDFSLNILKTGGTFVSKIFHGGLERELVSKLKKHFKKVSYFKPKSSRKDSPEIYVIAQKLAV
ncbi:MAG: RlmE family RNA methyltransferase [Rickettsiales bacterium]|jgi:23S rRNA (uridine2552-2'-O)-methyltransferase|nr:RlmE family RNA methyltransferase [Rickettsiales bacterium]